MNAPLNHQKIESKSAKVFAHSKNNTPSTLNLNYKSLCSFFNPKIFCGNLYYISIDNKYIKNRKRFKKKEYRGTVKNNNKLKNKNDI